MAKILKHIFFIIMLSVLVYADDSSENIDKNTQKESKKEQRKKTYEYIFKTIQRLYIDDSNVLLKPKCDISWQGEFCKGDIMCYSTKCVYDVATKDLYAITLVEHINSLQDSDDKILNQTMPRLKDMVEFGLPTDYKKHDFSFINSNNVLCKYWVWQRNKKTLELNITGCRENVEVQHTFIEERESADALGFYTKVLNEHIKFLESRVRPNIDLINRLRELIAFGLPRDNKKHDFSFTDSKNQVCKYWVWRKDKDTIEVNLTGCAKGVDILYTFSANDKSINGTIEIYSVIDSNVR